MPPEQHAPFGASILGTADQSGAELRVRLQVLTTIAVVIAQLVGVAAVVALNWWVLPRPEAITRTVVVAHAIAIPSYLLVAVVVGVVAGTRRALGRLGWLLEGRPPGREEQQATLQTPMSLVRMQAALWAGGVLVFSTLSLATQPANAPGVALSVVLGGLVTCTAAYLLTEFAMRPVAARALSSDPPQRLLVPGMTTRSLLAWGLGSGIPVAGLAVVAIVALARDDVATSQLAVAVLALGGTALLVGALLTVLAVRAVVDPVRSLRSALRRVERGDLDSEVLVYDGSEIGLLQASFNRMVVGLRERERIRDLFGRHVGEEVARDAIARNVELGGTVRDVSVLFVDVVGSTRLAAEQPAEEVVALLNRFFAVVVDVVDHHRGTVNKFQGDGALAVFGAPLPVEGHARCAAVAARSLRRRLATEVPELDAAVGVSTGAVVAGNVGEERRFEYTVIGDAVNEASRLSEEAKREPERVLAAAAVIASAGDEEQHWAPGDDLLLRGRPEPTRTWRLRDAGGR